MKGDASIYLSAMDVTLSPAPSVVALMPTWDYRVVFWEHQLPPGGSGISPDDMGWAELTSITAYRYNKYTRGQDADFNNLDLLYRSSDGGSFNRFKTFSQELRLQGDAFWEILTFLLNGLLFVLVGGWNLLVGSLLKSFY